MSEKLIYYAGRIFLLPTHHRKAAHIFVSGFFLFLRRKSDTYHKSQLTVHQSLTRIIHENNKSGTYRIVTIKFVSF